MSADWDEVKRLAADFQRAQLSSTIQRLSERNCIEIVKKLIESQLIEVIFTTDGKEYLTPSRVLKEIRDELLVHGGRINLVDLAQIIGIDYSHVEHKASEFLSSEPHTCMVLGQLITRDYLDHIAEEINEKLLQVGEISIAEITKLYDLPGEFLAKSIHERLGTIIQGQADSSDPRLIFTDAYIAQHTARIQGALSAITRPVPLSSIINHFRFPDKLFYRVAEDLIKQKRLAASITGGRSERSIFIPDIYAKSQNEWVDSFYKQNGYLEYDAVGRLGILDPKTYIKKKFTNEKLQYFSSCCVGPNILTQIEAAIEEALNSNTFVEVLPLLPSVFTPEDIQGIINAVTKSIAKQGVVVHVYCDTIVVSDELIKSCQASFETLMTEKAKEDILKKSYLFTLPQNTRTVPTKKEMSSKGKSDRKEEKKKKSTGGKSGGGTQGRETKTKNVKKKYFTERGNDDGASEEDEDTTPKTHKLDLDFLDICDIEKHIKNLESFKDSSEELITDIANEIHRPLTRRYQEVAKALFESSAAASGSNRRKQHADYQEKFTTLLSHIILFEKAAHLFPEDIAAQLLKHLLKTLCSDLTNMIINYLSQEHGFRSICDVDLNLTIEQRLKLISKIPDDVQQTLMKLHNSLNSKTLEDFYSAIDDAFGAGVCDMIIRKPDKKKERLILANHRQSLLQQLTDASEPALCLHLAVLVIFQSHTHNMLHASGKFVPHIITYLQKQVPFQVYELLATYQEYVIKKLTPSENEEEKTTIEADLIEKMPKIKETAVMYKKTSVSESEI